MGFDYPKHCVRQCLLKINEKFIREYGGDKYLEQCIKMPENEEQEKEYHDILNKIYAYHLNYFPVKKRKVIK